MLPENRVATHPGEILKEEFLGPSGITQVAFAQHIGVPLQRVNEIIRASGVLLQRLPGFCSSARDDPQFWMNLQNAYDLTSKRPERTVKRLIKAG